jgi:hypothetical protein
MSPWAFVGIGILAVTGAVVGWCVGTLALFILRDYDDIDWGDDVF